MNPLETLRHVGFSVAFGLRPLEPGRMAAEQSVDQSGYEAAHPTNGYKRMEKTTVIQPEDDLGPIQLNRQLRRYLGVGSAEELILQEGSYSNAGHEVDRALGHIAAHEHERSEFRGNTSAGSLSAK